VVGFHNWAVNMYTVFGVDSWFSHLYNYFQFVLLLGLVLCAQGLLDIICNHIESSRDQWFRGTGLYNKAVLIDITTIFREFW